MVGKEGCKCILEHEINCFQNPSLQQLVSTIYTKPTGSLYVYYDATTMLIVTTGPNDSIKSDSPTINNTV